MLTAMALVLVAASASGLSPGHVFMSTATGTGNLGTWAGAGGQSGLAAADTICRTEATAANVPNPETYIAAMSDSQNDFYCRLHGLAGKVSANCGQAALPAFAGPWLRRDGQVFATLGTLINDNAAITPASFHANATGALGAVAFNGTQLQMAVDTSSGTCADWTSNAAQSVVGTTAGTGIGFLMHASVACSQTRHIQCISAGLHSAFVVARASGREAFVTQTQGNGNLSTWAGAGGATGVAAGDAICQAEAAASGLVAPGSFKAWLSDSSASLNAIDRFQNDGPWVRTDGVPIAPSKAALQNPNTMTSPPVTLASGVFPSPVGSSWTGSNSAGNAAGGHCSGWTSTTGSVTYGYNGDLRFWTDISPNGSCSSTLGRLYCFSDLDRIFASSVEAIPY